MASRHDQQVSPILSRLPSALIEPSDAGDKGTQTQPTLTLVSLERALSVIERRGLSAVEFRVLIALVDRGCGLPELAERLDMPAVVVRRATRHLAMRGLVRRLHAGRGQETRVSLTTAGLATFRSLATVS
jgi:DNA-binding MarR family transcriptional regulator